MATPRANIEDLEDFEESINWLLFGDTGCGKTGLLGQLDNALILAAEKGTVSASRGAKNWYRRKPKNIKVWRILQWQDHPQGKDFVSAFEWVKAHPSKFQWICIDSITRAQTMAMRAIMERAVKRNPEKRDIDLPDQGEHQKWQNMIKRYIDDWVALPVNTLWTAQAMRREDADGDDLLLPYIYGKDYEISAYVCAQMDIVSHMSVVNESKRRVRRLLFEPDPPVWSKDRYDVFGPYVDLARYKDKEGWKQITDMPTLVQKILEAPGAGKEVSEKPPSKKAKSVAA